MQIEAHPFFQNVATEQVTQLGREAHLRRFAPHEVIFEEGSAAESFFLILEGEVVFQKKMPDGVSRTISHAKAGEFFGEIGVLTGEPRSLRAVAKDPLVMAEVPAEALRLYLKTIPGPLHTILNGIINHLKETTEHYVKDLLQQEKLAVIGYMMESIIRDFKTPFSVIGMGAQIMRLNHQDEQTAKLCQNIEEQVEHMLAIARELSAFARGQSNLRKSPVNLRQLGEKFRELNYNFFAHASISFELHLPDAWVFGQEDKLLLVLKNLVANAVDAIGERSGRISITGEQPTNHLVLLKVADNGGGIPEAIRKMVFEPFVSHGKPCGTGLGCPIAQAIVQAHGGTIRFETETGQGTTFFIKLPVCQPPDAV